jgi:hypothetical protein
MRLPKNRTKSITALRYGTRTVFLEAITHSIDDCSTVQLCGVVWYGVVWCFTVYRTGRERESQSRVVYYSCLLRKCVRCSDGTSMVGTAGTVIVVRD